MTNLDILSTYVTDQSFGTPAYIKRDSTGRFSNVSQKTETYIGLQITIEKRQISELVSLFLAVKNQNKNALEQAEYNIDKFQIVRHAESRLDSMKRAEFFLKFLAPISNWATDRLDSIENYRAAYEVIAQPESSQEALDRFLRRDAQNLGINELAVGNEYEVLKLVSQRFWEHAKLQDPSNPYVQFQELMDAFYKGEHFVFNDSGHTDYALYNALSQYGYLRGSSHYDHGTTNQQTGGPVPALPSQVNNPQYGVDGIHFKHLCFGRAELMKDPSTNTTYYGRDTNQAIRESGKSVHQLQGQKITWLQTEGAPDSTNIFTGNFWRHRVRDFSIYTLRKHVFHAEKPNVGPYGYGHGDRNPTVIGGPAHAPMIRS